MKKWILPAVALVVLGVIVTVSLLGSRPRGAPVETGRVERGEIRSVVTATGEIQAKTHVDISSQVIARIEKLRVREGDRVARGDRLVDLERAQYVSQRDRALATLAAAEADIRRASATLAYNESRLARARDLAAQKIASREFLESVELDHESARTALATARERAREARASVEAAQDALSKTTIVSPIAGRVTRVNAEEGETVVTGTMNMPGSVILTVSDLSSIEAAVEVDESAVARVRVGQKASVRLDAFPDRELTGEVTEIADSAVKRQEVAYFPVKVRIAGTGEGLRPGMTARARIQAESRKGVLVVPIQAIVEKKDVDGKSGSSSNPEGQKIVYRVEGGKARAAPVEVGLNDETRAEILSGVKEGEKIAVGPYRTLKSLRDGAAVTESATKK
ncbi:MAG: efflux RND transporter periplasmic adaptor subunit [Acidobacteriota bacterium]|nr:efflux RND transporter periplasmic adaptor subunit [Acidobacteriota bacterium]MDQ5873388.1 efflux RND transporter periplasmic adaptor subunit [Acidobacteriota bacterium]